MPLVMLFQLLGIVLALVGLADVGVAFLPAAMVAKVPAKLILAQGVGPSVSLLGMGAMIYLLAVIAAKRPAKSY
ncbi:hypothetical protein [Phenylobacterium aquaticum]|jgi:hypothetical protein|uniref:hypothetical protein n=1 Tax=Phenylobacterium aquaticum TaxID=1763816 RepID=UPI001F5D92CE|nr:hypothetical protein [Phenylobacterium aquaticum]MCI3131711.1 hypothetical protein [Phenylobacterium aquaticum]